jgi:hypothetical protein
MILTEADMKNLKQNNVYRLKEIGYLILINLLLGGSLLAADRENLKKGDVTVEGLTVMKTTRFTEVQVNKNVDWSKYNKYQIAPVEISFIKDWQQDYNRTQRSLSRQVTDNDVIRIKETMGEIVYSEFDDALKNRAGLKKVDTADSNTLLFKPRVINLDLYAPEVESSTVISRTYARQSMKATLFLEVYDAVSGQILARWIDTREDPDRGYFDWVNRITNNERARNIVRIWTERMVEGLDELKGEN